MTTAATINPIAQRLRLTALALVGDSLSDGQLLTSFIERGDEAAFAALVRRHGPMVLGVCRRGLGNAHDAEDAFQATFLVLVRKAASITPREQVGNWLYGVAYRTALEARARSARRRAKEVQVKNMPAPDRQAEPAWRDLEPLLDQALTGLPAKYRMPVVLCDLEGRSRKEVARHLQLPEGTLSSRLATARQLLAKRLARHGAAFSAGALAMVLPQHAAAAVPAALATGTLKAATLIAAGQAAAAAVSANVVALTQGVLKAMFLTKLKIATAVLLVIAILGTGAGLLVSPALADKGDKQKNADPSEFSGVVQTIDVAQNRITFAHGKGNAPKSFTIAKDAKVLLDDGSGDKLGFSEGKASDLASGMHATVKLSADGGEVLRVFVAGPTVHGTLKSLDAAKNTITATVSWSKTDPAEDKTFTLAKNVRITLDDGKAKDKDKSTPVKGASLSDLPLNATVSLKLSADKKVVGSIHAEGQTVRGVLKAVDAAKSSITINVTVAKNEPPAEKTFTVNKDASVFIDDGKKDKDKGKQGSLADLPVGCNVTLKLSLDQKGVISIRAEGSSSQGGKVEAVDAGKNTLTISDKQGEKTYKVMKDVLITIDGKSDKKTLGDVPLQSSVALKLLADQTTVCEISVFGPTVHGAVSGTAENERITLTGKEGDQTFTIAKDAVIMIEGSRRGKATELIDRTSATLRLSADKSAVLHINAEGPTSKGVVKAIDLKGGVITLTIGSKDGMGGEDRDFKFSKDTAVVTQLNSAPLKLEDIKTTHTVAVRMALDQKAANRIVVIEQE